MEVHGFRRSVTGRISIHLDIVEAGMLRSLADQLIALIEPPTNDVDPLEAMVGINPHAEVPDDPALSRLLPDAYRDDPEAAGEFRRFTDQTLRTSKGANARTVLADLQMESGKFRIPTEHVGSWLVFFTDVRLIVGTRLGITDEEIAATIHDLPDDDPRAGMGHVYDWLTYLQETLIRAAHPENFS